MICRDWQEDEVECPRYVADSSGTRVGCRFDELVGSQLTDTYFFLVNGTSEEAAVQFTDFAPFKGIQIAGAFAKCSATRVQDARSNHYARKDEDMLAGVAQWLSIDL
ncbi:Granulocyte-macrophage colony-stimulating factor receptor subunit alpha [Myotis brandtii]|uniref:Granulocyte-macrophage colony-stimulating factor receptor subunit alpha n=1 Tax=Myotis brandtii TaxID=109478 RepID=S7Q0G2_MYOBR|nr:Granulocyte-macrophage colony-stimulating factor receptor subunit alpha [Myotis brandtii]